MEQIGNVKLDYSCYCGKDLYSDGQIEDELLEAVKNHSEDEYDAIIKEKHNWAFLYHLSKTRQNIIDWMDDDKELSVLEVGAGCGAITGKLADKFGSVTAIDLSKKRSLINAYRNKDKSNLQILVGNYTDISDKIEEKFDIITLIGVFEYAKGYMNSKTPYVDFLNSLKSHLKPNGTIIIAIENKFGLKYWAGCVEDHKGKIYEGIEDYLNTSDVRTFTKKGLIEIVEKCNCKIEKFFYPYPDYKLPNVIYSDEYLPKIGNLNNNFNNFDADRIVTFDESKVFDTVIREGEFPNYSNSFLLFVKEEK